MSKPFQFKEFTIHQNQCAMKIGTDAVLLGAWANIDNNPNSILDIGTGTGILALMLAQRSVAETIEAVEIDENTYVQAVENFENSPWGNRLFCFHAGFLEFVLEMKNENYDLIIVNPPFYEENYKTENTQRDLARFQDALPFEHLLYGVAKLLAKNGEASFVIPFTQEKKLIQIAAQLKLYPKKITRVKGTETSKIKRSLISFTFQQQKIELTNLIIEAERHQYTTDYINLTKKFYLKM